MIDLTARLAAWRRRHARPQTVDEARSARKRFVRARTMPVRRLTREERELIELGRRIFPVTNHGRPKTRGECAGGERPCPFVSCEAHLYLDVSQKGGLKLNFPDLEVWQLKETCALDVADKGGTTPEGVADTMNIVRERVRQIEANAFRKLATRLPLWLGEDGES